MEESQTKGSSGNRGGNRRPSLTARAIALGVVVLILTISYASSLRIYFNQRQEISATQQEIEQRQHEIDNLQGEIDRWQDPAYVEAQARQRLGWVVPGETGFKVVDSQGKTIDGPAGVDEPESSAPSSADDESLGETAWWQNLWGSLNSADDPAPAPTPSQAPSEAPPITEDTKPHN